MGVQKSRKSLRGVKCARRAVTQTLVNQHNNKKKFTQFFEKHVFKKTDILYLRNRSAELSLFFE